MILLVPSNKLIHYTQERLQVVPCLPQDQSANFSKSFKNFFYCNSPNGREKMARRKTSLIRKTQVTETATGGN